MKCFRRWLFMNERKPQTNSTFEIGEIARTDWHARWTHTSILHMYMHICIWGQCEMELESYPEQQLWRNCAQGQRRISFIKMKRPTARCVYSGKLNVNVTVHMCASKSVWVCVHARVCVSVYTRVQASGAAEQDAAPLLANGKSALFVACWFFYACKHDASE